MGAIRSHTVDRVLVLTIDNPKKRNAFTGEMAASLMAQLKAADADPAVRALVITGAGDISFSSGEDLNDSVSFSGERGLGNEPFLAPRSLRKPVIAAINGHCVGGGLILATSCDIRVASENASFMSTGGRLGVIPEGRQMHDLAAHMGRGLAMEMMMTAEPISAERMLSSGFVSSVVPSEESAARAIGLASKISANSPAVMTAIKQTAVHFQDGDSLVIDSHERLLSLHLRAQSDAKEGMTAFLEKRRPIFRDI